MPYRTKIDLTGQRFGRLTVIRDSGKRTSGHVIWICKCTCGRQAKVISDNLRNGYTRSCGCLNKERMKVRGQANIKHGENDKSRLYTAWINLKRKCYNPNAITFKSFGAKKIKVCREWLDEKKGYINFRIWALNNGYSPGLRDFVIDLINSKGNYSPDNCRLITRSESTRKRIQGERVSHNENYVN